MAQTQDKQKEIEFFNRYAHSEDEYNVFSPRSNERLLDTCLQSAGISTGSRIADLGCGSGIFTSLLKKKGLNPVGVDLSPGLIERAKKLYPGTEFIVGDVEALPFESGSLDAVLLSGIIHHLPDPSKCMREVHRVLKPGGRFVAFDPNRMNPFMYLYRDHSSPFYSAQGVTENERPILASATKKLFEQAGFPEVNVNYLSGMHYRYIASPVARVALPIYNSFDTLLSLIPPLKPFFAFVITSGKK